MDVMFVDEEKKNRSVLPRLIQPIPVSAEPFHIQVWLFLTWPWSLEEQLKATTLFWSLTTEQMCQKCQDECCNGNQSAAEWANSFLMRTSIEDRISSCEIAANQVTYLFNLSISCLRIIEKTWFDCDTGDSLQGGAAPLYDFAALRLTGDQEKRVVDRFYIYISHILRYLLSGRVSDIIISTPPPPCLTVWWVLNLNPINKTPCRLAGSIAGLYSRYCYPVTLQSTNKLSWCHVL